MNKQRNQRTTLIVALVAILVLVFTATASASGGRPDNNSIRTYEVTIENLTPGQPLTPPLLAFHRRYGGYFGVGQPATEGIQEIAENGNLGPAITALNGDPKTFDVVTGAAPLVPAGTPGAAIFADSVTLTVETERSATLLTVASMLICTNDGFTGVDAVRLPKHVGDTATYYGGSYDAGSELNTEAFSDIVPPCQGLIGVTGDPGTGMSNPTLAENGVVTAPHVGIQGDADLVPAVHGWTDPAVRVTITRVPNVRTYEVTIRNLSGGQPLTPPLLATHSRAANLFTVGEAASEGIQQIAENGNLGPALAALGASGDVYDVVTGEFPLVPAGTPGAASFPDTVTLTITSAGDARFISYASMLICTNDGFTGLDSIRLPHREGQSQTHYGAAYDAGTEINTEYFGDIVPPCQGLIGVTGDAGTGASNPALAEGGDITHHPNIQGIADLLTDVHGWDDKVVEITITRVD